MVEHKAWDWEKTETNIWYRPAEIAYYLADRWKQKGFLRFLDLGCGLGRHSLFFAREGFTVHAIDLSEVAVDGLRTAAAEQNVSVTAQCGDMSALPYQDNAFDCLLAYHVISHTDTAGIKKILSEIRRVVKKGGEVYLTLCSKNAWSYKEAGFPIVDENTVIKVEDGPENGIPHGAFAGHPYYQYAAYTRCYRQWETVRFLAFLYIGRKSTKLKKFRFSV